MPQTRNRKEARIRKRVMPLSGEKRSASKDEENQDCYK